MASLAQWLSDLATRIGSEIKAVRLAMTLLAPKANPIFKDTAGVQSDGEYSFSRIDLRNATLRTASFETYYQTGYTDLVLTMENPTTPGLRRNVFSVDGATTVMTLRNRPVWKAQSGASTVDATPWDSVNFNPSDYASAASVNGKANIASPTFTGVPTAPTASAGTNTTQIASTAFVMTGLNLKASLSGAAFTGAISAPNHLTTFSTFVSGKPGTSEVVGGQIFPVATTITQANCRAVATVAATASTVFTIAKDGTTLGTITFAAGATLGTISITSGAVTALQNVTITAPATADATLANISFLVRA